MTETASLGDNGKEKELEPLSEIVIAETSLKELGGVREREGGKKRMRMGGWLRWLFPV